MAGPVGVRRTREIHRMMDDIERITGKVYETDGYLKEASFKYTGIHRSV